MRNLKKVLSLALAMVMLLGMMVVGAGAATEFKDASDIDDSRKVAAAVASAIEVLIGDENGNFNPDKTLTRAEAAVILTRLDLGASAAAALTATDASTFDDVGTGYGWAKAYIDYCYGNGYMIGVGGNKFAPAKTLTGVEFATMLNRVLGYRDSSEYGDNWTAVKAAALARKAGLGANVAVDGNEITRADMAQMVLNALTAPMVEYEGMDITIGDATFNSKAVTRKHANDSGNKNSTYKNESIVPNITPIRLCEEKFPYLKLDTTEEDGFGHTAAVWKYRNVGITNSETTVPADITIHGAVNSTVPEWADIKGLSYADDAVLFINGYEYDRTGFPVDKDGKRTMAAFAEKITGNGRQVEIYLNEAKLNVIDKVVVIDTALAEVTKVVDSDESISVKLVKSAVTDANVVLNTKHGFGEFKKGDLVLVQGYGPAVLGKNTTITSVEEAVERSGFATVKKYDDEKKASYITVEGTNYYDALGVMAKFSVNDFNLNTEFNSTLYLDKHDYIMKAIQGKDPNATTDNLIAVKKAYRTLTGGEIAEMIQGVLSNGQTVTWRVDTNADSKVNTIQVYEKLNNGQYKLTDVNAGGNITSPGAKDATSNTYVSNVYAKDDAAKVEFKSSQVFGKENGDKFMYSDTVKFIFVDKDEGVTVVNGRQNYNFEKKAGEGAKVIAQAMKATDNGVFEITAVFVSDKADVADLNDVIYVSSRYREWDEVITRDDGTRVQYYGYTAYDAKGNPIDKFLGVDDKMADQFFVSDKNEDGAYKRTAPTMLSTHSMTKGILAKANGLTGDAFVLVRYNGSVESSHYDFLGHSSTVVKDLTNEKLYIESISEMNEAVNNNWKVTVAVLYNATETPATTPSIETVRVPVTIYITGLEKLKEGDTTSIPSHNPGDPVKPAPEVNKVAIVADAGVTYTVDGKPNTETSVDVKSGESIKLVATLKDGYKWKDATATGISDKTYTATAKGGETITIPATEKTSVTYTLTVNMPVDSEAKVYLDGVVKAADKTVATATGDAKTWNIKADTKVMIEDDSTFTVAGTILLDGVDATVNGTTNRASFTMSKNMTVTLGAAATDVMFAVTFHDGITLDKFLKGNGTEVKPADQKGNTYYVKASDGVQDIVVKLNGHDTAVATSEDTFDAAYYSTIANTKWWEPGATNTSVQLNKTIDRNVNVFAAVRVDFDTTASRVMFLGQPVCWNGSSVSGNTWETFLVAPDAEYAVGGDNDDLAGLIVTALGAANPKTSKTAIGGTLKVEKTGMKLWGAYALHLTGVESVKVASTGEVVKNGEYVVSGTTIDATADGVNLICINEKGYAVGPLSDIVVNSGNMDQIAKATKITLGGTSLTPVITLSVASNAPGGWTEITKNTTNTAQEVYVAPSADVKYSVVGDTFTGTAAKVIKVEHANVATGDSGANTATAGAWAYFTVTGYDNVTVTEVAPD